MTELYCGTLQIDGAPVGETSEFPAMHDLLGGEITARVEESDGLFIGYGLLTNPLPYSMQDRYGSEMRPLSFETVELENDFLHAVFLPELGGRLWSLLDKETGRDLVHRNVVFKPGNFAIRNAWVAGGVEWNVGRRGHDALTSSPLFTARLRDDDGTPVLRFYEFSRTYGAVYQMDFFLPEKSRFLLARMRVVNPLPHLIPMYWWSNIAIATRGEERIVVPAETAFVSTYVNDVTHAIVKLPLPDAEGYDCTYPVNHPSAKDVFFNIPAGRRKYEAAINRDGGGMIHASTPRLQGRKLFVWGQNPGGHHWQSKLTAPGAPEYLEIQAGLAQTQMECLPMPPETAWEWLEAYGAIRCDPARIFGDWEEAKAETSAQLENLLPDGTLEAILDRTRDGFARRPAEELLRSGSGWGTLENLRRPSPLTAHLDFGEPGPEQAAWRSLLERGSIGEHPPVSWMVAPEWHALLKRAARGTDRDNWRTWLHLAVCEFQRRDFERAMAAAERSLELEETAFGLYAKANILRSGGDVVAASGWMVRALALRPDDESLAKETLRMLLEAERFDETVRVVERVLPKRLREIPMIRFLLASAFVRTRRRWEAERILELDGGLDVPDIREGENSLSELYLAIRREEAAEAGIPFDPETIKIPFRFDLRMNVGKHAENAGSNP